jgi:hypothetical protein
MVKGVVRRSRRCRVKCVDPWSRWNRLINSAEVAKDAFRRVIGQSDYVRHAQLPRFGTALDP